MLRKRLTTSFLFACLLCLFDIAHVNAADMEERAALVDEVRFLISRKDYPALERLHSAFMDPSARLPSGTWKLAFFYHTLEESLLKDPDPEYWKTKEQAALGWRKNFPSSSAAQIYLAYVHLRHAWTVRGSQFASEVRAWP